MEGEAEIEDSVNAPSSKISFDLGVRALRDHCKSNGLVSRGTKAQVWARLKNHLGLKDEVAIISDDEDSGDTLQTMDRHLQKMPGKPAEIFSGLSIRQLREHCKNAKLVSRGTKDEVWHRLKTHLKLEEMAETPDEQQHLGEEEEPAEESEQESEEAVIDDEQDSDFIDDGDVPMRQDSAESDLNLQQFVLSGDQKRTLVVPEKLSPAPSMIEDDDDSNSQDISVDSSFKNRDQCDFDSSDSDL